MENDMLIKALEVLDTEARAKGSEEFKIIHEHIEAALYNASEEAIKAIAERKKTLAGAFDKMADEAKKKKTGNYAVLSSFEAFRIVDKYFGVDVSEAEKKETAVLKNKKAVSIFDL